MEAYKQLPLLPAHSRFAIVSLWDPDLDRARFFRPRTLLFGSTLAVLHYNGLSRLIATLSCRLLGIPCLGYYDDFVIIAPEDRIALALDAIIAFSRAVELVMQDRAKRALRSITGGYLSPCPMAAVAAF